MNLTGADMLIAEGKDRLAAERQSTQTLIIENDVLRKTISAIVLQCRAAQYLDADARLHVRMWKAVELLAAKSLKQP